MAYCAVTVVFDEEVNAMSCPNENCRKGGCTTDPQPSRPANGPKR